MLPVTSLLLFGAMNLPDYLQASGLTQTEFARRIGRTQGAVSQWLRCATKVSAENAIRIEKATGGAVTAAELRPDVFGERAA